MSTTIEFDFGNNLILKLCVLHQEAIQTGSTMRVVEHLEEQAIREIREATEAYRRKATKQ